MAGSPWANSRYPPYPAQYAPGAAGSAPGPPAAGSSFDPRRVQYGQPPPAGFYNPAVFSQQRGPAEYQAFAPPSMMPQPHIPSVLTPGSAHRSPSYPALRANSGDLPDLFFTKGPSFPTPHILPQVPPRQSSSQVPQGPHPIPPPHVSQGHPHPPPPPIRQTVSAPAPPVPRKPSFNQPPLPPKPTHTSPPGTLPLSAPGPSTFRERRPSTAPVPFPGLPTFQDVPQPLGSPGPMEESDEALRAALQQSARDAEAAKKREEEELARAMAESLSISKSRPVNTYGTSSASGSRMPHSASSMGASSSAPHSAYSSPSPPGSSKPIAHSPEPLHATVANGSSHYTPSPPAMSQQILDDEALARRLAEEDVELETRQRQEAERAQAQANAQQAEQARRAAEQLRAAEPPSQIPLPPPEYSPSIPALPTPSTVPPTPELSSLSPPVVTPGASRRSSPAQSGPPSPQIDLPRRSSATAVPFPSPPAHDADGRAARSQSFGAYGGAPAPPSVRPPLPHSQSTNGLRPPGPSPQLPSVPERTSSVSQQSQQPQQPGGDSPNSGNGSPTPNGGVPGSSSQFVDNALLRGVSKCLPFLLSIFGSF